MKKKISLLFLTSLLTSCNTVKYQSVFFSVPCEIINEDVVFPLDTITTLKMYEQIKLDKVKNEFSNIITNQSHLFDRYHTYNGLNNLKTINDSIGTNTSIEVNDDLINLVSLGIDLTKISKGAFNLAMGSLIDLYAPLFNTNIVNELPSNDKIEKALASIPSYEEIEDIIIVDKENKTISLNTFNDNNVVISLGGIAKGYALEKAYLYLKEYNYPCIFDSGSSSMVIMGANPTNKEGTYKISFRNPNNPSELLPSISITNDYFISTSGSYEKFFKYTDNGIEKTMHHIYDTKTGYSNNYIQSVSLLSNNCSPAILDAMTTAIFNIKDLDEILSLVDNIEKNYNCDISFIMINKNKISISRSFKNLMTDEFNSSYIENVIEGY